MPPNLWRILSALGSLTLIILILLKPLTVMAFKNTGIYYIRLDHSFAFQKFTHSRVTMVPAENEFRAENFSLVIVDGTVYGDPQTRQQTVASMAQKDVFTKILLSHGLKSVQTQNQNTTVSYEGAAVNPPSITISSYEATLGGFPYTAKIRFSPISFPDRWELLHQRYNIKQILNDFFLLFK